ncbi:MAG: signal peptidase II [Gammaproteobacteria bacterium TMED112]|nr:MAG: signal peptidase II [Gammaproteobacteria bacterium TMED112]
MKFFLLFLALLSIDLSLKWYLNNSNIESITLIPHFLDYFLTKNTGIALSLFSSSGNLTQILLLVLIFLALIFLTHTFLKTKDKVQKLGLLLVLAGGFGNFIERFFYGAVTDYLHLRIGTTSLFVFNFADFLITLGAVLIIFIWMRGEKIA